MSNDQRKRLEPLRLGSPPENDPQQPPPTPARGRNVTARWGLLALAALGLAGVGASATVLLVSPGSNPTGATAPSVTAAGPTPRTKASDAGTAGWTASLRALVCEVPCCGGAACANEGDSGTARACVSGVTCIPGDCDTLLDGSERWTLHLSAVVERATDGGVVDACKPPRDIWLCVKSREQPQPICLSQIDACGHEHKSVAAVPITTEDLTNRGLEMQVREGGPTGRLLATKSDVRFPGGIKRRALCGGLRTRFASSEPVAYVTFFLDHVEPSLSGDARSGVSHVACKPESWIPRVPALDDDARRDATVKHVGDLNSDGLPEYEIDYQNAATGWGMTLLSSTGGPDCFLAVYEGSGAISSISKKQTDGWSDLTITYSAIVGDKGRGLVTAVARRVAGRYGLQQLVHCQTLGGDDVPLSECQGTLPLTPRDVSR